MLTIQEGVLCGMFRPKIEGKNRRVFTVEGWPGFWYIDKLAKRLDIEHTKDVCIINGRFCSMKRCEAIDKLFAAAGYAVGSPDKEAETKDDENADAESRRDDATNAKNFSDGSAEFNA